jgi:hypothetical protein
MTIPRLVMLVMNQRMHSQVGHTLEAQIGLVLLSHLPHQPLEGQLADELHKDTQTQQERGISISISISIKWAGP